MTVLPIETRGEHGRRSIKRTSHGNVKGSVLNKIVKIEEPNLECYEGWKTLYLEGERSHLAVDQQVEKITLMVYTK